MEKCPECQGEELGEQEITKGGKTIGINVFCKNMNCNYEIDKPLGERKNRNNKFRI